MLLHKNNVTSSKYCELTATRMQPMLAPKIKCEINASSACRGLNTLWTYVISDGRINIAMIVGMIQIKQSTMLIF